MWIANQAQPNPLFWLPARKWDVERVKHVGFHAAPAAGPLRNLHVFALYNLVTSMGWNLGRALTSVVLLAVIGPGLLHVLRRAARRGAFTR